MLVYAESGNTVTMNYGDIDAPFYDPLFSMMSSIEKLAPTVGIDAHTDCAKRLKGTSIGCRTLAMRWNPAVVSAGS